MICERDLTFMVSRQNKLLECCRELFSPPNLLKFNINTKEPDYEITKKENIR